MKTHLATTPAPTPVLRPSRATSFLDLAQAALAWSAAAWARRRQHMRELRELQAMSDRELRDLNLTRADVHAIVAGYYCPG